MVNCSKLTFGSMWGYEMWYSLGMGYFNGLGGIAYPSHLENANMTDDEVCPSERM